MISVQERQYINKVIEHLSQPAWMTESDLRVCNVLKNLVLRHDVVEKELQKLKQNFND